MNAPASPLDFSQRRLELAASYQDSGAFASLELHPGWPERHEPTEGYRCALCPSQRWWPGAPALWVDYGEQAGVDLEVGAWTITVCRECTDAAENGGGAVVDALIHYEIASREHYDAEVGGSRAAWRMKSAQLEAAAAFVGAVLAPVLAAAGCDRETARLALSDLGLDQHFTEAALDDVPTWSG